MSDDNFNFSEASAANMMSSLKVMGAAIGLDMGVPGANRAAEKLIDSHAQRPVVDPNAPTIESLLAKHDAVAALHGGGVLIGMDQSLGANAVVWLSSKTMDGCTYQIYHDAGALVMVLFYKDKIGANRMDITSHLKRIHFRNMTLEVGGTRPCAS